MSSFAVQNSEQINKANTICWAFTGGLTGFALKHALPVTKKEKNTEKYSKFKNHLQKHYENNLDNYIKAVKQDAENDPAGKIFTDNFGGSKKLTDILNSEAFRAASSEVQQTVKDIIEGYRILKTNGQKNLEIILEDAVKSVRSTNKYTLIGASIGFLSAIVKNLLDKNGRRIEREQKLIDATKNYIG